MMCVFVQQRDGAFHHQPKSNLKVAEEYQCLNCRLGIKYKQVQKTLPGMISFDITYFILWYWLIILLLITSKHNQIRQNLFISQLIRHHPDVWLLASVITKSAEVVKYQNYSSTIDFKLFFFH